MLAYNVALTFAFRICDGLATGIWASSVLSNFISVTQGDDNTKVGIAQALQGSFLVATAIPAAWVSGRIRRTYILRMHSTAAFAAIVILMSALVHFGDVPSLQFIVLCVGLSLMGMAQASAPIVDSLFADSIATGKRAGFYTALTVSYVLSSAVGPATAATLFMLHGDSWSTQRMSVVMLVGLCPACVPATLLLFFDDTRVLGQEAEGLLKVMGRHSQERQRYDEERGLTEPLLPDGTDEEVYGECGKSDDLEGFESKLHTPADSRIGSTTVTPHLSPTPHPLSPRHNTTLPTTPTRSSHTAPLPHTQLQAQPHLQPITTQRVMPVPPGAPAPPSSAPPPPGTPPPQRLNRVKSKRRQSEVESQAPPGSTTTPSSGTASPSEAHTLSPSTSRAFSRSTSARQSTFSAAQRLAAQGGASKQGLNFAAPSPHHASSTSSRRASSSAPRTSMTGSVDEPDQPHHAHQQHQHQHQQQKQAASQLSGGDAATHDSSVHVQWVADGGAVGGGDAGGVQPGAPAGPRLTKLSSFAVPIQEGASEEGSRSGSPSSGPRSPHGEHSSVQVGGGSREHKVDGGEQKEVGSGQNEHGIDQTEGGSEQKEGNSGQNEHGIDQKEGGSELKEERGSDLREGGGAPGVGLAPSGADGEADVSASKAAAGAAGAAEVSGRGGDANAGNGEVRTGARVSAGAPHELESANSRISQPPPTPADHTHDTSDHTHTMPAPTAPTPTNPTLTSTTAPPTSTHTNTPPARAPSPSSAAAAAAAAAARSAHTQQAQQAHANRAAKDAHAAAARAAAAAVMRGGDKAVDKSVDKAGPKEVSEQKGEGRVDGKERVVLQGAREGRVGDGERVVVEREVGVTGAVAGVAGMEGVHAEQQQQENDHHHHHHQQQQQQQEVQQQQQQRQQRQQQQEVQLQQEQQQELQWGVQQEQQGLQEVQQELHQEVHEQQQEQQEAQLEVQQEEQRQQQEQQEQQGDQVLEGCHKAEGHRASQQEKAPHAHERHASLLAQHGGWGSQANTSGVAPAHAPPPPPPPPSRAGQQQITPMQERPPAATSCGCLTPASIPYILAITDCCMGLASGMTIKFFPIFFRTQAKLSPSGVSFMYTAIPLALSCAALFAQRQARIIGRVQTMVTNRLIGIMLLLLIAVRTDLWSIPAAMVPLYICRTCIMNAQYPIQRSILMDYVPKESRARWASVESVTQFGWSGSAALGGFLIERYGFQTTFFVTSGMQLVGWFSSLMLLPLVPRKELSVVAMQQQQQQQQQQRRQ